MFVKFINKKTDPETIPEAKLEEYSKLERVISIEKNQTFWKRLSKIYLTSNKDRGKLSFKQAGN